MLYKLYSAESVPSPSSSVNVTKKILIELRTLFLGLLVQKRSLFLLSHLSQAKLQPFAQQRQYIKPAHNSQASGIEPVTIPSDVKWSASPELILWIILFFSGLTFGYIEGSNNGNNGMYSRHLRSRKFETKTRDRLTLLLPAYSCFAPPMVLKLC